MLNKILDFFLIKRKSHCTINGQDIDIVEYEVLQYLTKQKRIHDTSLPSGNICRFLEIKYPHSSVYSALKSLDRKKMIIKERVMESRYPELNIYGYKVTEEVFDEMTNLILNA